MQNLKLNEQRSKNAIILIWIVFAMEIISFISSFMQYILIQEAANGEVISVEYANSNDSREQIVGIIYMVAYFISGVTFIQWFRRAYFNLHLKVNRLSQNEGWAAGSWFVPIVNLYRPYQIMKELFVETNFFFKRNEISVNKDFATVSLSMWWTLWIINNFLGQFIFKYSMRAETIDELTISTIANMVSNVLGIPLAIITIRIIKEYSSVERLLSEAVLIE